MVPSGHWRLLFHLKHTICSEKGESLCRASAKREGSLLLLKGCKIYYAQFYQNGKQVRELTGRRVKQEALVKLREIMGRADKGHTPITELEKDTYGDLRAALIADYANAKVRTTRWSNVRTVARRL